MAGLTNRVPVRDFRSGTPLRWNETLQQYKSGHCEHTNRIPLLPPALIQYTLSDPQMSSLFLFFILFWTRLIVPGASIDSGAVYTIKNTVTQTVIDLSGGTNGVQ
jgi:hypothetical protein